MTGPAWAPLERSDAGLPELDARLEELPRDKAVVVVVGHAGSRSALATRHVLEAGLPRVANLRGGLSRWAEGRSAGHRPRRRPTEPALSRSHSGLGCEPVRSPIHGLP
ncbi:MAG: rhodanese-like domain-containing protein [Cyanobacteriota bacterium]|nr:rhodanese-like domain-containing protein [Cyanobacteriota bacterium]